MTKEILLVSPTDLESVIRKVFLEVLASQEPMKEDKLLTTAEASELLGVDRTTLWRWDKEKYLVPVRIGSRKRYNQSDIEKLCRR